MTNGVVRSSIKVDEREKLKSGNADPNARLNEGTYRGGRGGGGQGRHLCPRLLSGSLLRVNKTSSELSWKVKIDEQNMNKQTKRAG